MKAAEGINVGLDQAGKRIYELEDRNVEII